MTDHLGRSEAPRDCSWHADFDSRMEMNEMMAEVQTVDAIDLIVQQPQRQDGLDDQLRDVLRAATKLGCYDAADWIRRSTYSPAHGRGITEEES